MIHTLAEADHFEAFAGAGDGVCHRRAGIHEREFHIGEGGRAVQQVELLEDEADGLVAQVRQLVTAELREGTALDQQFAAGRHVECADQVHQRRLARARRAHDRGHLALDEIDIDAAQGENVLCPHAIDLGQVAA